jgi:hypothetical protein
MTSPLLSASTARVSVKLLAPFVSAAQQLGMHVERALAGVGLSLADLDNPELRVGHAVLEHMLRDAQRRSGVRDLGLLAAECLSADHLEVVEYAARSQPTLRAGLERAARYYALLHDGLKAQFEVAGDTVVLQISFGGLPVDASIYEFVLAAHVLSVPFVALPNSDPSNPDGLGCGAVGKELQMTGAEFITALGDASDFINIDEANLKPCEGDEYKMPALDPEKQEDIVLQSAVPFFNAHLGSTADIRQDGCRYLVYEMPKLPSVTLE